MNIDNSKTSGYYSNNAGPQGEPFALNGLGGTPHSPSSPSEIQDVQNMSRGAVVQIWEALLQLYIALANSEFDTCLKNRGGKNALEFPSDDPSDCERRLGEAKEAVALQVAESLGSLAQVGGKNEGVITIASNGVSDQVRQTFDAALRSKGIDFREESVQRNADAA